MRKLIFDLEGDGLLRKISRVHCLGLVDPDSNERWMFRHNDVENNIQEGLDLLEKADVVIGHNIIAFDIPALKVVYPAFNPRGTKRDTLVMCRVAAADIKDHDVGLWRKGLLPGGLIGSHGLEAWGYRLGQHKGDYKKIMEAKGLDPWAAWNQEMEDYCVDDVSLTLTLWRLIVDQAVPETCIELEHNIHALCARMETNGFPFDMAAASRLTAQLKSEVEQLRQKCEQKYGVKAQPVRKKWIKAPWNAPTKVEKTYEKPDPDYGEDDSRKWWGEVTDPKREFTRNGITYRPGEPYCKLKWVPFNPGSRTQIVDRLVDEGWTPTEFTDAGAPVTDDAVLKVVGETIPIAADIAELLFLQKLIGQMETGNNSWANCYNEETGCLHPHTNTGGAVTGRCTHSHPNVAQVSGVLVGDVIDKNTGKVSIKFHLPDGSIDPRVYKPDGTYYKKLPLLGRAGEYGWESRSLFRVPEHWVQVGIDLKGIEFRCLAELVAEFDGGELIEVVCNGDPHQYNMDKTGIPSRDIVKRVLYGLLYGAGDEKLGYTAKPTASPLEAKAIGAKLRRQLMEGLPALKRAIDRVQGEAQKGYLIGLDGRRLKVRSPHSALNTRLQSDAALIAKKWLCLTEEMAIDSGMFHGWRDGEFYGDFAMLAFIHDEQQNAVNPDRADEFAAIGVKAANEAGKFFGFQCPIDADPKIGKNWAECH